MCAQHIVLPCRAVVSAWRAIFKSRDRCKNSPGRPRAFAWMHARRSSFSPVSPGAQCDIHLLEVIGNASRGFASGFLTSTSTQRLPVGDLRHCRSMVFFRSYRYFPFTRKDGIRTCQIFQVFVLYQPKSTGYLFFVELHAIPNSLCQPAKAAEPIFVG